MTLKEYWRYCGIKPQSTVTKRRLRDGAEALSLPEPKSLEEKKQQLDQLHWAICAMQSLDDLGSKEANDAAWNRMLGLQKRYKDLKAEIESETNSR